MTKTAKKQKDTNKMEFGADVSKLLDIVINALYTNQDVFLRELISNAADACDKLRYEAIQNPDLTKDQANFRIHIYPDTEKRTLTIVDNGIGMNREELIDHLGTIAKSGTQALMEQMKEIQKDNKSADQLQLIGQFGVGFYASFMVADQVEVISRKAGTNEIHQWSSDGKSGFTIDGATGDILDGERGTAITLHLKDDASDYLLDEKIKHTTQQYSDHIDVKIFLSKPVDTDQGEGQPINKAAAIWTRPKNEITDEQYTEFYRHLTFGFDEPLLTAHWKAEGKIEFTALLYIPTMRPMDLYDPSRKGTLKLYVKRVFISDTVEGLTYPWLRFVRGVVDSEDLPLNISRETLQYNPLIAKIRTAITKRILSELAKLAEKDKPGFLTFWGQFGPTIKEGLYDAAEHRDDIFKICRFASTHDDSLTSLDDYVERMKDEQKEIYYISGENLESLKNSPQIEGFQSRGLEVLFFTDPIDDFWLQQTPDYKDKTFKSVTQGDIDLKSFEEKKDDNDQKAETAEHPDLIAALNTILKDEVQKVTLSSRLTDSPVCIVASDEGIDMNMERVLKIHQKYEGQSKPVLEINAEHALIKKLSEIAKKDKGADDLKSAAFTLLDQAKIIQGQAISNPTDFVKRLSDLMEKAL